jgi:hypothetical protein
MAKLKAGSGPGTMGARPMGGKTAKSSIGPSGSGQGFSGKDRDAKYRPSRDSSGGKNNVGSSLGADGQNKFQRQMNAKRSSQGGMKPVGHN